MSALLEFNRVSCEAGFVYEAGIANLSFVLQPGDLALVELATGRTRFPLADLACGLTAPDEGSVKFDGRDWVSYAPDEAAAARGAIGRAFEETGWLSNLDVDENITLAARYHRGVADVEILDEANLLARRLGLSGLPAGRPSFVPRQELRRAEWVRALLGPKKLVVLERPLRDLPLTWSEPLLAEMERRRAGGLAVLWLQRSDDAVGAERLKPTLLFNEESGNIVRV